MSPYLIFIVVPFHMNLKYTKILVRKDASIGWFPIYAEMANMSADCEACCHFGNLIL